MKIIQRNDFQNFTLDSVLLSGFVKINRKTKKILDVGTGCGIIALLLAQRSKAQITGIELQKTMAEIAERNVENNKLIFTNKDLNVEGDLKNTANIQTKNDIKINGKNIENTGLIVADKKININLRR